MVPCSCVGELSELLGLLEENPTVQFSTLVQDHEENFKVLCCTMLSVLEDVWSNYRDIILYVLSSKPNVWFDSVPTYYLCHLAWADQKCRHALYIV